MECAKEWIKCLLGVVIGVHGVCKRMDQVSIGGSDRCAWSVQKNGSSVY